MLYHTYGLSNSQQHGQIGKSVISTTPLIAWSGINPHPGNIVVSLHKTLNNDWLCLSALNKQKTQQTRIWRNSLEYWIYENFKTGADSSKHKAVNAIKSVRIIPQLASDAARWQEDKYVQQLILPLLKKYFAVINHILYLKKGFKVIPLFAVTSDFESPNQHALNLHLQGQNVQSHHSLEDLLTSKTFINLQASKNIFTDWWNELDKYVFFQWTDSVFSYW